MKSPKSSPKNASKKSNASSKVNLDKSKNDAIVEKQYVTREIETSITLLDSPEDAVVLEALLFLSKYADTQENNLSFLQKHGIIPKLLLMLERNICILRVSLRLFFKLLTTKDGLDEIKKDEFDGFIEKIGKFFAEHEDEQVQELSLNALAEYSKIYRKLSVIAADPIVLRALLKKLPKAEDETLVRLMELFYRLIEFPAVLTQLTQEDVFDLDFFISLVYKLPANADMAMDILRKLTYLADSEALFTHFKDHKLVEYMLDIAVDPGKQEIQQKALEVVKNCMGSPITNSYFVETLEFLKFNNFAKTCADDVLSWCTDIFLELSKIDALRQTLFDLSIEDTVLSFLRSDNLVDVNKTLEAISNMSVHKYCCERMVTPIVIRKILEVLQQTGNSAEFETALKCLHNFARRDTRTVYMIHTCQGIDLMWAYLKKGEDGSLSAQSHRKILDIVALFVSNNHLRTDFISPDLYDTLLRQLKNTSSPDISVKLFEILHYCLEEDDFRETFLQKNGPHLVANKIEDCKKERLLKFITGFVHECLMYEELAEKMIRAKLLPILKAIPESVALRIPLIKRTIGLIYNTCLPIKFYETGRLELTDKLSKRFYVLTGTWCGPFPFLEILEMQKISTMCTIYVVDFYESAGLAELSKCCFEGDSSSLSLGSFSSATLNYGGLSRDPYLPKYVAQMQKLLMGLVSVTDKVQILSEYVDACLCGPEKDRSVPDKMHDFKLHLEAIKFKLGTNMIPIGYLRMGFQREKAILFKALADQVLVPATLVRGPNGLFYNEVAQVLHLGSPKGEEYLELYVVDLMEHLGCMMVAGSREANMYCGIK